MEIIRVWDEEQGWVHQVRLGDIVLASSRHRDELQDQYPQAAILGKVICGNETYTEG